MERGMLLQRRSNACRHARKHEGAVRGGSRTLSNWSTASIAFSRTGTSQHADRYTVICLSVTLGWSSSPGIRMAFTACLHALHVQISQCNSQGGDIGWREMRQHQPVTWSSLVGSSTVVSFDKFAMEARPTCGSPEIIPCATAPDGKPCSHASTYPRAGIV